MVYENKVVYGPINSRRLGKSLGINLTPLDKKICSFDCIYCHGGPTKLKAIDIKPEDTFSLGTVKEELERMFDYHKQKCTKIDYISIVGITEPTIYPRFLEFINLFFSLQNQYFPNKPTAIFTNCTTLDKKEVRLAIQKFNRRFFKLDAGDEKTFQRINRPVKNIHLKDIIENLIKMQDIEISIGVIGGFEGNYNSLHNKSFINILKKIKPIKIYIYDMDRPIPLEDGNVFRMMRTNKEKLIELADYFSRNVGIEVIILREKKSRGIHELVRSQNSYTHKPFVENKNEK